MNKKAEIIHRLFVASRSRVNEKQRQLPTLNLPNVSLWHARLKPTKQFIYTDLFFAREEIPLVRLRYILPLLPIALVACGGSDDQSAPTGQVVARVAGEDVTIGELNAELAGARLPEGVDRNQVEQQAAQAIVERKLLANEAKNRKVDENPAYLLQKRRAEEMLLVQMLRDQITNAVPRPSRAEAETYINNNPSLFASRRLYILDQIQFPARPDQEFVKKLSATKTMDELEQLLLQSGVEYRRAPSSLDTITAPVQLSKQLESLPAGEVFIVRQGPAFIANRIVETRNMPFSGEKAIEFAQNRLRSERVQERLQKEAKAVNDKGKDQVVYQDKFKPSSTQAPAAAKPATPAK